jgi:hypothetical protein
MRETPWEAGHPPLPDAWIFQMPPGRTRQEPRRQLVWR